MLRPTNGRRLLKGPNPLMVDQDRGSWGGGTEENFGELGEVSVERGDPRHAQDVESFLAMEEHGASDDVDERHDEESNVLDYDDYDEEDKEMLRRLDGSPYVPSGNADNYDPSNPDHDLMDSVDQEVIEQSGAPIEYYRVIVDGRVDPLYNEQRQKIFLQQPVTMMAVWEPATPAWNDITIGFSSDETMLFSFNRIEFLEIMGEQPAIGSIIKTCDEGTWWEIVNNKVNVENEDRKMWGKHRFVVTCNKYQPTVTDSSPTKLGRESHDRGDRPVKIL
jgi:hypothetical protein